MTNLLIALIAFLLISAVVQVVRVSELLSKVNKEDVNEIVKIILELNKDKYLVHQVERYWVEDGQIFTNLKSFDFNIKIGNSNNLKEKIKKLKAYCVYYNKETSNLNYNQIDLTYNNQLVAIKN